MQNKWFVAGALCLAGCASKPEAMPEITPQTAAIAPTATAAQPQVFVTVTPPVLQTDPTPMAPDSPAFDVNSAQPATSETAQESVEDKQ